MSDVLNYSSNSGPNRRSKLTLAVWVAVLYPLVYALLLYAEWIIGWQVLGHRPRPSIDDPKSIGLTVTAFHSLNMLMLLSLLPVGFAGFILAIMHGFAPRRGTSAGLALFCWVLVWGGTFYVFRWDPFHVMNWWMD